MSQQGVVVDFTFGVKANQHFQLAAESHGLGFNSRAYYIITVLGRINNEIDILLAVFLAEDRIAFRYRIIGKFGKNGEELVGTAVEAKSMGFGGELKVLVGFNAEGKIYNYSLLAHTETPGLGSKADKWFGAYDPAKGEKAVSHEESTKSILGMNPGEAPLTVSKDGGAVDAITASTITSRAFLNAVNAAYQAYKAEGGEVNGVTGASQKAKGADADAADAATGATIKVELTDSVSAK